MAGLVAENRPMVDCERKSIARIPYKIAIRKPEYFSVFWLIRFLYGDLFVID